MDWIAGYWKLIPFTFIHFTLGDLLVALCIFSMPGLLYFPLACLWYVQIQSMASFWNIEQEFFPISMWRIKDHVLTIWIKDRFWKKWFLRECGLILFPSSHSGFWILSASIVSFSQKGKLKALFSWPILHCISSSWHCEGNLRSYPLLTIHDWRIWLMSDSNESKGQIEKNLSM